MTVVFSTYQSINVIENAQKDHGLPDFDLIICDEAHRTTGKIVDDKEDSNFVRVHDQNHIRGYKRLYMTATPRIFSASTKRDAHEGSIELCSMDNENLFGKVFHYYSFGKAVENNLLSDYRVVVLALWTRVKSAASCKSFSRETMNSISTAQPEYLAATKR